MGFFDRAKQWLGMDAAEREDVATDAAPSPVARGREVRGSASGRDVKGRPPLKDVEPPPQIGVDEVLAAREAGDLSGARKILREIDRGHGLRTVLRAAAALEAGDEHELGPLLAAVGSEEPRYKLPLQVAAALADPAQARPYLDRAAKEGAPDWAIAWSRVLSEDATTRREGLVDLLYADPALARTVAARDLAATGVEADPASAGRYASFAHGRDSIRRFGASIVARVLDRAGHGSAS